MKSIYWLAFYYWVIHSFIPLACAECDDSLPFSGASSIPLCYVLFPATLFHQLFFHPLSPHLAIYFLVYLSILLFPYSYTIPFWEFNFLPFSVHAQTNIIYLTLLSLLFHYWYSTITLFLIIKMIHQNSYLKIVKFYCCNPYQCNNYNGTILWSFTRPFLTGK